MEALTKAKSPIALTFRKDAVLSAQWTRAEAVQEVSAAIELHSTNRVYYSNCILMLLQTKEYEAALRDCQRIRELDPRSTYIKGHYLRGLTLFHLARFKNAASAFQTVIKLNSGFKKAADRLAECLTKLVAEDTAEKQRRDSQNELLRQQFAAKQSEIDAMAAVAVAEKKEVDEVEVAVEAKDKSEEVEVVEAVDAVDADVVVVDS